MLGSLTSNTASMSRLPVWRMWRTSWALLACRALRKRSFSFLTASCLGLGSSMTFPREGPCSMYGTAKPAGSDTNTLHTAWRRLEKNPQMVIMKDSSIPTMEVLYNPSHQPLYGRCMGKEDRNQVEDEGQQVTGGKQYLWSEIRLNINSKTRGRDWRAKADWG